MRNSLYISYCCNNTIWHSTNQSALKQQPDILMLTVLWVSWNRADTGWSHLGMAPSHGLCSALLHTVSCSSRTSRPPGAEFLTDTTKSKNSKRKHTMFVKAHNSHSILSSNIALAKQLVSWIQHNGVEKYTLIRETAKSHSKGCGFGERWRITVFPILL